MFVNQWMTQDPVTLAPEMSISAAAARMGQYKFRHMPVAASAATGKKLLGMVSKYDIARAFPRDFNPFSIEVSPDTVPAPISSIMTRSVVTVAPDCDIEKAASILRTRRINGLPVIHHEHLVGIITESDIFAALLTMTGFTSRGIKLALESEDVENPVLSLAQACEQHKMRIQGFTSFHDQLVKQKTHSIVHLSSRPNTGFSHEIASLGFRVRSISNQT
ncbi:MAG TPA: CBS domain-containing protein [Candidatus Binatia bacterium]|jgi:acetoin utilization protein AcuB